VLQRQLGATRVRLAPADRAFLAALPHRLPHQTLRKLRLLVAPTRSCAGIATCWPDATPPRPDRNAQADHGPYAPSEHSSCAWPPRIPTGDTAASMANC
jgi:hypothetical protein